MPITSPPSLFCLLAGQDSVSQGAARRYMLEMTECYWSGPRMIALSVVSFCSLIWNCFGPCKKQPLLCMFLTMLFQIPPFPFSFKLLSITTSLLNQLLPRSPVSIKVAPCCKIQWQILTPHPMWFVCSICQNWSYVPFWNISFP